LSYPSPFNLEGKVALITGAASGLGIEFAEAMAEAGAHVACADLQDASRTVAKVEALGREAIAIECDVASEPSVEAMVAKVVERFGRLDILFNNAGIADAAPGPLHAYPSENWHQVIDIDLHGVFYCAKHALKVMVGQGSGKIVNIASIWGITGASSVLPIPAYNAAKGAVVNLTRELGLEYATLGIQANAICPGFFFSRLAGGAYDDPEFVAAVSAFTPMGRVAEAREIRGAAIFLASDASSYMTGQMLVLDGGVLAK
jgi:NAD(P)-dependent dehydrogenase (short-subunit alcohol dehydrogenase family)